MTIDWSHTGVDNGHPTMTRQSLVIFLNHGECFSEPSGREATTRKNWHVLLKCMRWKVHSVLCLAEWNWQEDALEAIFIFHKYGLVCRLMQHFEHSRYGQEDWLDFNAAAGLLVCAPLQFCTIQCQPGTQTETTARCLVKHLDKKLHHEYILYNFNVCGSPYQTDISLLYTYIDNIDYYNIAIHMLYIIYIFLK